MGFLHVRALVMPLKKVHTHYDFYLACQNRHLNYLGTQRNIFKKIEKK